MVRVLLVEDDPLLRKGMARAISKMSSFVVEAVSMVGEAAAAIRMSPPDILVSDINLPDGSGIGLLGVLRADQLDIPVILASGFLANYRGLIPMGNDIVFLEKPFKFDELRQTIKKSMIGRERKSSTGGKLSRTAADYIELACLGTHSVSLCIKDGGAFAEIIVMSGEIWSARDQYGSGVEAYQRLALMQDVSCELCANQPFPRNIYEDSFSLLSSTHRNLPSPELELPSSDVAELFASESDDDKDEKVHTACGLLSEVEESREPVKTTQPSALGSKVGLEERFSEHWDRGVEAILSRDLVQAAEEFSAALVLKPDDAGTLANIERLRQLEKQASNS